MRYTFFSFLLPFSLLANLGTVNATEVNLKSSVNNNQKSNQVEFSFVSRKLVQQQINLIARIEKALSEPDSNQMRTVGGKLITHTVVVERFLKRQYPYPQALCKHNVYKNDRNDSIPPLSGSKSKIYCSLYNSSRELSRLTPILDRLLSRRGELAIVRELPLVSGEKQSDLVLPMSPLSRPDLGKLATPYAILEPSGQQSASLYIGKRKKSAIANYVPPVQPAIKPPSEALTILENAQNYLAKAISVFPSTNKFENPKKTAAKLDRLAYDIDLQEKQSYEKLLSMPNTGIFRALPYQAYLRSLNTVKNRSQKNVLSRYPFPVLGESKGDFTPNLPLQIVKGKFQILPKGIDYSFIADIGDISLSELDASLENISPEKRDIFINYQPPNKLNALQEERQKFISGKYKNSNQIEAKLNHTYLVRHVQFQLPEIIVNNQPLTRKQRRYIDELLRMQSSDVILAFTPVSRRSDGSYTVIWRVLQQLDAPRINDLEDYLRYQ